MSLTNRFAVVDYAPGASLGIIGTVLASDAKTAGVPQADVVQLVAELQAFRTALAHPGVMRLACVSKGRIQKVIWSAKMEMPKGCDAAYPVVGDEPFAKDADTRRAMLAIDGVIRSIADAPQGGIAHSPGTLAMMPATLVTMPIIVTGIAVTVLAGVAIWRYFNPDLRARLGALAEASRAYAARLRIFQSSGTMPPPSEAEKNLPTLAAPADAESKHDWIWGVALAVGVPVGLVGAAAFNRALQGR